jgi:hypothetical protein
VDIFSDLNCALNSTVVVVEAVHLDEVHRVAAGLESEQVGGGCASVVLFYFNLILL